ncbi:hypothetical protein BT63DRAFT_413882 [Microthyrium microscopicum]|uniref:Uncharacterized protein n=1 Tax=Microthyrium microscopicum TaxID=703497 RepID=A0A6A6UCU1_9PEZI|nr:hypothetical protein BT63DRAFT_413882 [Microthyrium microscopicum]
MALSMLFVAEDWPIQWHKTNGRVDLLSKSPLVRRRLQGGPYEAKWTETAYDGAEDSDVLEVPMHLHVEHDEYVQILEGRMTATINGKATILDPSKGRITIPRSDTHGFKVFKGEQMTAKEWSSPAGKYKELGGFFRDMLGGESLPGFWGSLRAFLSHDAYPSLCFKMLDRLMSENVFPLSTCWGAYRAISLLLCLVESQSCSVLGSSVGQEQK